MKRIVFTAFVAVLVAGIRMTSCAQVLEAPPRDAVFDRNKDYKSNDKKPEETNPSVQTKILKIEFPWKNKEELKKLEREEDLKILRRDRWQDRLY